MSVKKKGKRRKSKGNEKVRGRVRIVIFTIISIMLLFMYSKIISRAEADDVNVLEARTVNMNAENNKSAIVKHKYLTNPTYVHFRKHYCPDCSGIMEVKFDSEIVKSEPAEAKCP